MKSVRSSTVKRALSLLLCVAFVVCTCLCATPMAYASKASDLQAKKAKIAQQINEAQSKIDKLAGQKKETQEYISALDSKIQLLQDELDVVQAEADKLQASINEVQSKITKTIEEIDATQRAIDQKQKEFDQTFDDYCQRLRAIYISGHATNLEVLLTSSDISSILTRSQMIKSVSKKDSDALNALMRKMEEIEKDKANLEKKRLELKENKEKLTNEKAELQKNIDKISATKSELDSKVSEANALMRKLNSQTAEYQESINSDRAQMAKVEAEIQAAYASASTSSGVATGYTQGSTGNGAHSGTLGYPTSYRTISAGYPNYSSGRFHGGIDFPCPRGTAVHAAASGTVIVAKNLNYSYGHYLIIDHGNGLSTLYAHNTTLLVGVGSKVSKGQQIASSGSTGNSTGPHCHFEVRINGNRVNPLSYL